MKMVEKILLLALVCCCLITCKIGDDMDQSSRPNIIILYADDMGYGDLISQNPDSKIPTPNIDRLIEEGMRFTDGHSSSGICTPSRYALLTGRYHWRDFHNIVGPMGPSVFKQDQFTLPRMLRQNGYATGCVGKWHLGWDWEAIRKKDWTQQDSMELWNRIQKFYPPQAYDWSLSIPAGPLEQGFDYYYGDGTINFPPYAWVENDRVLQEPTVSMTTPEGEALEGSWEARPGPALADWDFFDVLPTIAQKASEFVRKQGNSKKPFFLYVPFSSPHAPIIPNEEFRGKSGAGPYGDFVHQTDWCIGEILRALDEIGETKNTIVIFTADNGPERYAYDRIRNYEHHSAFPFRGLKRDIFEGGHHVPFIVKWPGHVKANSTNDQVIHQVDLLKTLAKITKADLPKGLAHDGYDFSEELMGPSSQNAIRSVTVHNTFEDKYALRAGDWLYINVPDGAHSRVPEWVDSHFNYSPAQTNVLLFNLIEDIGQRNNLSERMPEKVLEMERLLVKARSQETFIEP